MAMRALLYSFGGSEQDAHGNLVLKSRQTLEAIKYVMALYQDALTPEVLTWDAASNNSVMLAGKGSLAINAISVTRTGEDQQLPVTDKIWLAKAAQGPERRIGLEHLLNVYVIWKFARNVADARKFLIDYVGSFKRAFAASRFYNFPCFPDTVPDLKKQIANDPKAMPPSKYAVSRRPERTAARFSGHSNAASTDLQHLGVERDIHKAATGETPERALDTAQAQC
jgi:multiple sugar transport system substrate-binding protein